MLRRGFLLHSPGEIYSYLHNSPPSSVPSLGKMAGVVSLISPDGGLSSAMKNSVEEENLGMRLAMQIVGLNPMYLDKDSVDAGHLEKEMRILREQALSENKPESIVDKIVLGRMSKFYEEVCLMDQKYVVDDSCTVKQVLKTVAKKGGDINGLKVNKFLRVECGQGLDAKATKSFNEEVAELAGVA